MITQLDRIIEEHLAEKPRHVLNDMLLVGSVFGKPTDVELSDFYPAAVAEGYMTEERLMRARDEWHLLITNVAPDSFGHNRVVDILENRLGARCEKSAVLESQRLHVL